MYSAKVVCDSISYTEERLITMVWTYPRIVLAEVNTHRMLSKNTASSRAIPKHDQGSTAESDANLYARLVDSRPMHASPFEHQACVPGPREDYKKSNLHGWIHRLPTD